ncbi:MFS transporter [Planctomicrobium piriforme]|uniref:Sugar transporter n=1 Tax=Planctomicrobium piriforme TaxID=1576369 RepID=A0A1I3L4W1_9PLAN|nr:MFS transporter [Planctomicrobium piriforme]SFI79718.1 Sugar transporter [Planctomicrobium piriforme]
MSKPMSNSGKWAALGAAILGWMFDGFEMGLFPLVADPALRDLLQTQDSGETGKWIGIITAGFLVGAATGGVLFGWLGDRIGRVRAMALSILTYALFSGLCGFANSATTLLIFRVLASLGMGGEWSLGVSLVMELWPNKSRGWLAGVIGAASNVGFILDAVLSMGLITVLESLRGFMLTIGLPMETVERLLSNGGWRVLMMCGAAPALLTFVIRLFVPESEKWQEEETKGTTSNWATVDLLGVLIGSLGPLGMLYLWADNRVPLSLRIVGTLLGLTMAIFGYLYPVTRYLTRIGGSQVLLGAGKQPVRKLMLLGAMLSGVALLGTWGSMQWAAPWAASLTKGTELTHAKEYTQIALGVGAVVGTILAALVGHRFGRRITYFGLCILALASAQLFFGTNTKFDTWFVVSGLLGGATTAAFYGWLPLYLPELFPTSVRATGQGFAFNFGRILAAVGTLQTGALMKEVFQGSYPKACSVMSCVYLIGMVVIWFVPETKGDDLPS